MNVKIKDTAVLYNGKRYEKDAELIIEESHYNEALFICVEKSDKQVQKPETKKKSTTKKK